MYRLSLNKECSNCLLSCKLIHSIPLIDKLVDVLYPPLVAVFESDEGQLAEDVRLLVLDDAARVVD